jgi:hypothetical protein
MFAGNVDDVRQLVAGSVAAHSMVTPDVKDTVPEALPVSPLSASTDLFPKVTVAGVALAVNDVAACPTVRLVVAVDPE